MSMTEYKRKSTNFLESQHKQMSQVLYTCTCNVTINYIYNIHYILNIGLTEYSRVNVTISAHTSGGVGPNVTIEIVIVTGGNHDI